MHRFILHFALASLLILTATCTKEEPVQPPPTTTNQPPDTTSHDFIWHYDTIGTSAAIFDIYAINDTDVWAVGDIRTPQTYTRDSLGTLIQPYNGARWNGKRWELIRIAENVAPFIPIESVFAFSRNDVWCGSTTPHRWNGVSWRWYSVAGGFDGWIRVIYGVSPNEVYFAGTNGALAYFDGSTVRKIVTNLQLDFNSIAKGPDGRIYVTGYKDNTGEDGYIALENKAVVGTWISMRPWVIRSDSVSGPVQLVYGSKDSLLFAMLDGRFYTTTSPPVPAFMRDIRNYIPRWGKPEAIAGTAYNNVFIAGHYRSLLHFNGSSWTQMHFYGESGIFYGVAAYGRHVFCGGLLNFIYRGERIGK